MGDADFQGVHVPILLNERQSDREEMLLRAIHRFSG